MEALPIVSRPIATAPIATAPIASAPTATGAEKVGPRIAGPRATPARTSNPILCTPGSRSRKPLLSSLDPMSAPRSLSDRSSHAEGINLGVVNEPSGTDPSTSQPSATAKGIVSCSDLSRRFGEGQAAVDALRGVSLDFPPAS